MDNIGQAHLWHDIWLFGIIVDNDKEYYDDHDSEGWSLNVERQLGYYVPDDVDTDYSLCWESVEI